MKKLLSLIFLIAFMSQLNAQTHLYENPDFDKIAKEHKIIAIVPFKTQVTLRPKQMKDMTSEQLYRMERSEGEGLQTAMYSWFLKRKKRGTMTIEVQDPKRTNALLKKEDIDYDNIQDQLPEDLAKILGVDAVISGDFETNKPMSEGASAALGILVGFWEAQTTLL